MNLIIVIIALLTLAAMKFAPPSSFLRVGQYYLNRRDDLVYVKYQEKIGKFDIFITSDGIRYFGDGARVGDSYRRSPHKLVTKVDIEERVRALAKTAY